jgi:hypothetical protein
MVACRVTPSQAKILANVKTVMHLSVRARRARVNDQAGDSQDQDLRATDHPDLRLQS